MIPFTELSRRSQSGRLRLLALDALASYELRPLRITPLGRSDNTAFRIDAEESGHERRFVLRIHRMSGTPWHPVRDRTAVESELAWLAALRRETDLVVPEPAPNRFGELTTLASIDGVPEPRICVLFRWVEGRFLNTGLTPAHMERVGEFMARLHEHALTFERPAGFTRGRVGDLSAEVESYVLDTVLEARGRNAAVIAGEVIARARATYAVLDEVPFNVTLIHGDLHQENYLFRGGVVRAIDFDDCGFGHLLWDFAVTLSEVSYKPNYFALRTGLLGGYQRIRPLPAGFEQSVNPIMSLRLLQLALWFLEMREDPAFSDWEDEVRQLMEELEESVARP